MGSDIIGMLDQLWLILTLQSGLNTTVVLIGTAILGAGAGVIGSFVLLRKRALVSDAVSHATLPGIAIGFLVAYHLGLDGGRNLPILLLGAAGTGVLGVLAVQWIKDHTRLAEDTAIASVLSVFFGAGMVLLSYIQAMSGGARAGLGSFLLGQTAALSRGEAEMIAGAAVVVIVLALLFLKEFGAVAFDPDFAASLGWPIGRIDLFLMALMLVVVCLGLKTVGLVLIVALLIIPPVTARLWTDRLGRMVWIAGLFGAISCFGGAALSALLPRLPAGGVIVLTAGALFAVSLAFAPGRGLIAGTVRHLRYRLRVAERQGLLMVAAHRPVTDRLQHLTLRAAGWIGPAGVPTAAGATAAAGMAADQRLWDRFLADYPQQALHLETWADRPIGSVLPADLVTELGRRVTSS